MGRMRGDLHAMSSYWIPAFAGITKKPKDGRLRRETIIGFPLFVRTMSEKRRLLGP